MGNFVKYDKFNMLKLVLVLLSDNQPIQKYVEGRLNNPNNLKDPST